MIDSLIDFFVSEGFTENESFTVENLKFKFKIKGNFSDLLLFKRNLIHWFKIEDKYCIPLKNYKEIESFKDYDSVVFFIKENKQIDVFAYEMKTISSVRINEDEFLGEINLQKFKKSIDFTV